MNYRIFGTGRPLVAIHPFAGRARPIPALAGRYRQVAIELDPPARARGEPSPGRPFERHADRIAALLRDLRIERADFFGESLGGIVAIRIAIAYPELVDRVAVYGAALSSFEAVAHSRSLAQLMQLAAGAAWPGFPSDELAAIDAPVLLAAGDRDVLGPRLEHHLDAYRRLRNAKLAIIPDAGHFTTADDVALWSIVARFFDAGRDPAPTRAAARDAVSWAIEASTTN